MLAFAHIVIVSTTRPMSCLTLRSRSGEPIWPRKYLETTILVACCDQAFGISTSRLFEHHLTAFVADERRADFPLDLVERVDAGFREEARECQPRRGGRRPRFRARLLRLDKRRHRSRSTAFQPTAGRHLRPGRLRPLSSRPLRSFRGHLPGSRRSPPAHGGNRRTCVGKIVAAQRPKTCCELTRSWEILARSLCRTRRTNMRSA